MALRLTGRRRRDRVLENLVLRQQLAVWERTGRRAPRVPADRQFWSLTARHWTPWRQHLQLVRPATVARWHRTVTRHPTAAWVWRQIIAATAWSHQPRYLIRDRDARFGSAFNARLHGIGIRPIVTPYRAPQANAIVKRSMGTIRRECLDSLLVLHARHLRRVLREYSAYYNAVRPHQSLGGEPPDGPRVATGPGGRLQARPILGGLHHEYRWEAA